LTRCPATLAVGTAPGITTQPQNRSASVGWTAYFGVVASGTAPLSYQWRFNGVNLAGQIYNALSLAAVTPAQAGSYDVVVSNVAGTVISSPATLTVDIPPSITMQPQDEAVNAGQTATFAVIASGIP